MSNMLLNPFWFAQNGGGGGSGFKTRTVYQNMTADRIDAGGGVYYLDFESFGDGQPIAAIFTALHHNVFAAYGTSSTQHQGSFGVTDGVNQWSQSWAGNQRSTTGRTDSVIFYGNGTNGSSTAAGRHAFHSWLTDGVRLRSYGTSGDSMIVCTLIYGDGVDVACGVTNGPNTTSKSINVGFEPNALICGSLHYLSLSYNGVNTYPYGGTLGFHSWDGSTLGNAEYMWSWDTPGGAWGTRGRVGSWIGYYQTLVSMDPTGFTFSAGSNRTGNYFGYLAIGGIKAHAGVATIPTGTGSKDILVAGTPPAWTPESGLWVPTRIRLSDGTTDMTDATALKFGISHLSPNARIMQGWAVSDQSSGEGQVNNMWNENGPLNLRPHNNGTPYVTGAWDSFLPGGIRTTMSVGAPEALQAPMLLMAP